MKYGLALAVVAFCATVSLAQEDAEQPADEEQATDEQLIEELVITAKKKGGDPVNLETLHEELIREQIMYERERMRVIEEENEWRKSSSTTADETPRMQWGYSPQDELRMRREFDLTDMPGETTKPATVFRIGF